MLNQPCAIKSTTPMVLVHVHRFPNKQNHPRAICPNETVGAVPMCPPERPRSGVSMQKTHTLCAGILTMDAPLQGTRAGTQAPPLPISIIFFHTILHKQKNHLHAIRPKETNRPCAIRPYPSPLYIYTSGAEMHRALPPPFFKTSFVCKLASR